MAPRRDSCRDARSVGECAAMRANLSWTLSPGVLFVAALAAGVYVSRWRHVRRAAGPRRGVEAPVWRLCCFLASVVCWRWRRSSRRSTRSPTSCSSMHMVQHMLLLDLVPILAILGMTKVLLRPVTRAVHELERRAGPLAHPGLRGASCYVGRDLGLAHPGGLRPGACATTRARARAPQLPGRRLAVLVAPALADPRAPAPGRHGPGRLHGLDQAVRRRARHGARVRPLGALPLLRAPRPRVGPLRARRPVDRRADHGGRAVARDGRRARRAVHRARWPSQSARSSAASATSSRAL